eukprot:TRINITY_DN7088_c0_g1_i1.p1 TRINITY_DN7088_c0_g1~~TRINITY_DN7088_c0_g1_i1.p1  ORF type:complete len:814 (+),score=74.45 TRINITY_DN7088_c0_g1_i1:104-2545(+)
MAARSMWDIDDLMRQLVSLLNFRDHVRLAMTNKSLRTKVGCSFLVKIKAPYHLGPEAFARSVRYLLRPLKHPVTGAKSQVTKLNLTANEPMTFVYWRVGHKDAFEPLNPTVRELTYRYSEQDVQRSRIFPYPREYFPHVTSICFMGVNMMRMVEFFEMNTNKLEKIKILDIGSASPAPLYKRIGALTHRPRKIVISFMTKMAEYPGWARGVESLKIRDWNNKSNIFHRILCSRYSFDQLVDMIENYTGLQAPSIQLDGMPIMPAVMSAFYWRERDPVLLESTYRRTFPTRLQLSRQLRSIIRCAEYRGHSVYKTYPSAVTNWLVSKLDAISTEGSLEALLLACSQPYLLGLESDEARPSLDPILQSLLDFFPRDLPRHLRWAHAQLFPDAPCRPMFRLHDLSKLGLDPISSFICDPNVVQYKDAALNESIVASLLGEIDACRDVSILRYLLEILPTSSTESSRLNNHLFSADISAACLRRLKHLRPTENASLLISSRAYRQTGPDSLMMPLKRFEELRPQSHTDPLSSIEGGTSIRSDTLERSMIESIKSSLSSGTLAVEAVINMYLDHGVDDTSNSDLWTRILRAVGACRIPESVVPKIKSSFCGLSDLHRQRLRTYLPGLSHVPCFVTEFRTFYNSLEARDKVSLKLKDVIAGLSVREIHDLLKHHTDSACALLFHFSTIEPSFVHLEYVCKTYLHTYFDACYDQARLGEFPTNPIAVVMDEIDKTYQRSKADFPRSLQLVSLWMRAFADDNPNLWMFATKSSWWLVSPLAHDMPIHPFKNLALVGNLDKVYQALSHFHYELPHPISPLSP